MARRAMTRGERIGGMLAAAVAVIAAFPIIAMTAGLAIPIVGGLIFWIWYAATRVRIGASHFAGAPDFGTAAQRLASEFPALHRYVGNAFQEVLEVRYTRKFKRIRAERELLVLSRQSDSLIIAPATYWSMLDGQASIGLTPDVQIKPFAHELRSTQLGEQDEVLDESWQYATKTGDRDLRYKDNYEVYVVRRFGFEIRLQDGTRWRFGRLPLESCVFIISDFLQIFGKSLTSESDARHLLEELTGANETDQFTDGVKIDSDIGQDHPDDDKSFDQIGLKQSQRREWFQILGVDCQASREEIKAARDKLVRQYHPDRLQAVEGLSPDFEALANQKLAEINGAYEEGKTHIASRVSNPEEPPIWW